MDAVKPSALFVTSHNMMRVTMFDPIALARPWMRLCIQLAVSNFAMQAHIAQTAMYLPQVAAARGLR